MMKRKMMKRALLVILVLTLSFSPLVSDIGMPGNVGAVMAATRSMGTEKQLREALKVSGTTVKLTGDITGVREGFVISKGTHTLDLNGHTIKGSFSKSWSAIYLTGGSLVIKDSSKKKTGLIWNTSSDGYGIYVCNPENKVRIEISGGKVKAATALNFTGNGKLTVNIKDGKFEGSTAASFAGWTYTISGGDFDAKYTALDIQNMLTKYACKVTVTGGTFHGLDAVTMQHNPAVTISGGTFHGSSSDLCIYKSYSGKRKIDMKLFEKVYDVSKEGLGVTESKFKCIDVKYERGMKVEDADTLYSVVESASQSLTKKIEFVTNEHFYNVLTFYLEDWDAGKSSNSRCDTNVVGDEYTITLKRSYSLEYETQRVLENPKLSRAASDKANGYAKQIRKILNKQIKSGMTQRQKAVAIHDYMVANYSYDKSFKEDSYHFYGPLKNKKAVCQGFATLYRLCMLAEGIECECVFGTATSGPGKTDYETHMWNRVKLNKTWYYVDVTFDNGSKSKKFLLLKKDKFYGLGYHYELLK